MSTAASTDATEPRASAGTSRAAALRGARIREAWHRAPRPVRWLLGLLVVLFFYALPILNPPIISTPDTDFGGVLFTVAVYALVAIGLNIVVGYAGLLDMGYVGFYAVGAYTVAVLTSEHGSWPFLLVLPIAMLTTMVSGILLGAPTLRVRGDYLAIVTLGFGEIVRLTLVNSEWLGAAAGISKIPSPPDLPLFTVPHISWDTGVPLVDLGRTTTFLEFGVLDQVPYYWVALTVILVVLFFDKRLKESRVGRAWEATREDEDAAEIMGVATFKFKLLAFALGALVGGLAGALFATKQGFVNPQSFALLLSVMFLAAVVVGGQGNRWGVILGAVVVAYLPERFRGFEEWRVLVFGLALMLLATYRPEGLIPPGRTARVKKARKEVAALEEGDVEDTPSDPYAGAAGSGALNRQRSADTLATHTDPRTGEETSSHD
ncbi:branched-chain amino acid ABC transporter permease [Ornithinimicrobium tianjinense]|uniref:Branched-chain amino acid ABC transporter permease n=1 Tax=Ornithinimicrobium tianjinense TaxID=1195761 RepID=A0A917F1S2_9MICO|nr:branched-chain amino acid ABC transporter permease [Ornithinimicrobium tianjinense]GGF41596.1 branched-chain amino acid ABC transporter permease [Ornithinimicrobium tianjinense]